MKKFFKKLVGKETEENAASNIASQPREKVPCSGENHREPPFQCWNDHCHNKICQNCAQPPNENSEILCKLCTVSALNMAGGEMAFGSSDEEETKAFSGGGMAQVARVSFDPESSQVVGWESIWAIIDGEETEKTALKEKLNQGIGAYVEQNVPRKLNPNISGGIAKFKDYEIVIEDERNFILKHKDDIDPAI